MIVSRAMRRLLGVLQLEEEQRREALENALGELRLLQQARDQAVERERRGRRLVVAGAESGEIADRLAGLEETRVGARRSAALKPLIAAAQAQVEARRQEFLTKRVERRQAETLLEQAEAQKALVTGRRGQQALDNWHLNRLRRKEVNEQTPDGSRPPGWKSA
jgi:hypothetical protein